MVRIRLRPNVAYDWLGQRREGGKTYEMDEGEAEYVRKSNMEFDPNEQPVPPSATGEPSLEGRFAAQIKKSLKARAKVAEPEDG